MDTQAVVLSTGEESREIRRERWDLYRPRHLGSDFTMRRWSTYLPALDTVRPKRPNVYLYLYVLYVRASASSLGIDVYFNSIGPLVLEPQGHAAESYKH